MSADVIYLDTSALVKLVMREAESDSLREHLGTRPRQASSALARVELLRAARRIGASTIAQATRVLADLTLLAIDEAILDEAAKAEPRSLRSLDAIHLTSAQTVGSALAELITYDRRLAEAAESVGIPVSAPA